MYENNFHWNEIGNRNGRSLCDLINYFIIFSCMCQSINVFTRENSPNILMCMWKKILVFCVVTGNWNKKKHNITTKKQEKNERFVKGDKVK